MDFGLSQEMLGSAPALLAAVFGPLLAATIAVWQVNQGNKSRQKFEHERFDRDQRGVLRALRSELSANIYALLEYLEATSDPTKPRPTPVIERHIYLANAGRVAETTSRAFGMLATIYSRFDRYFQRTDASGGRSEGLSEEGLAILGHAALARTAFGAFLEGRSHIKLSEIRDEEFHTSVLDFTAREQELLKKGRAAWLDLVQQSGMT